ncbi:MAG: heavy-metal-associated domain-containing protein [Pseudomonadota bacterium]
MKTITAVIAATTMAFATPCAAAQTGEATTVETSAETLTVNVKGMVCDFCAQAVTKVFGREDAVNDVHVDLDLGEIHVRLKPGLTLADDKIEALVRQSGYAFVSVGRETS